MSVCHVHFATALHNANQCIAAAPDGDHPARKAAYGCKRSDSAVAGLSRQACVTITSRHTFWHVVCFSLWIIADASPHTHELVGQESIPMATSHELTLLDVIQAVSEVAENDQEIITTAVHLISSGQVRLCNEAIEAINHLVATMDAAA
jgi:hypothetical protein